MSEEIPCPYCGQDLLPGREALENHLEGCSNAPETGQIYAGKAEEHEEPAPEALPEK